MKKVTSTYSRARSIVTFLFVVAFSSSCRTFGNLPPSRSGSESAQAKDALVNFFAYLNAGKYDQAVSVFEPWEEGVGEQKSSWAGLSGFSPANERNDHSKVLSHYCDSVGSCLRVEVLEVRQIAEGQYSMRARFVKKDGSMFVRGRCCGTTEAQMPPTSVFEYYVHKRGGRYVVRTPPVFTP